MAVLVTGSSGFVGQRVVRALAGHGAAPVAFDVAPPARSALPDGVPFVQGSIVNNEEVMAAIAEHRVQQVIALSYIMAPLNDPGFHDYTGAVRVNLLGVTNTFEAARLLGVTRVIFASSCAVCTGRRRITASGVSPKTTRSFQAVSMG